jgi:hypothetical protein
VNEPRFDRCALPPPDGDWAYEVDDVTISYGPGWRPFHKHGEPAAVRLAPNTAYRAWRNEYVPVNPVGEAAARARLSVFLTPQGVGGLVVTTRAHVDLRARTATVDPARARMPAQVKADRLLALVLTARAECRRHRSRPITAHDRFIASKEEP